MIYIKPVGAPGFGQLSSTFIRIRVPTNLPRAGAYFTVAGRRLIVVTFSRPTGWFNHALAAEAAGFCVSWSYVAKLSPSF